MAEERPFLRVVRGDATPEEIAVVVAVLTARVTAARTGEPAPRPSAWARRAGLVRWPLSAGSGAWRASGLPR